MSKMRTLKLVGLPMLALLIPVAAAQASDTPCTDRFNACQESGHSYDYCDGLFCGCLDATYGAGSCEQTTLTAVSHEDLERSLKHDKSHKPRTRAEMSVPQSQSPVAPLFFESSSACRTK
jgi:hypothetical protein